MNNNRSWSSIGEELRDAVGKALEDGDFTTLGDAAVNTMSDTLKNVETLVQQAVNNTADTVNYNYTEKMAQVTKERKRAQEARKKEEAERRARETERNREARVRNRNDRNMVVNNGKQMIPYVPFQPIGKVSSVLYRVFGGIGTGSSILATLFFGVSTIIDAVFLPATLISLGLLACFGTMIGIGCKQKEKLMRARRYLQITGNNHYINIEDLAQHVNKTPRYILRDIKRLMEEGFFPEGHLDKQGTCFMLDNKIYNEYLMLEKQRTVQQHENTQKQQSIQAPEVNRHSSDSELDAMISYGQDCIRKLREMNDNIAGEEISAKLFRLENLLKEIFDRLREHPEQKNQMQKFLNYYLPTTLKLVASYEQFDSLSSQSEDILEAKAEIEKTLDTINSAFGELLNRLLRMTAFDVTTDAQVLQTMLAKEGLTKDLDVDKISK